MAKGPSSLLYAESKIRWLIRRHCPILHLSWDFIRSLPEWASTLQGAGEIQGERPDMPCCCVPWGKSQNIEYLFDEKVLENGLW